VPDSNVFNLLGYPVTCKKSGYEKKVDKDLEGVVILLRLTETTNVSLG
jgi:hypothetical protein